MLRGIDPRWSPSPYCILSAGNPVWQYSGGGTTLQSALSAVCAGALRFCLHTHPAWHWGSQGNILWFTKRCLSALSRSISAVYLRTACSVHGNSVHKWRELRSSDWLGSYSDILICLLSLARWCHLVLLGQLICSTVQHHMLAFAYEILGCAWMAHRDFGASLWPDGNCWYNITPSTVMEVDMRRCWKLHFRQGWGKHEDFFRHYVSFLVRNWRYP